jgi:hypothetical protein
MILVTSGDGRMTIYELKLKWLLIINFINHYLSSLLTNTYGGVFNLSCVSLS